MQTIEDALAKLNKSKFRSRFHLKQEDIDYIDKKGLEKIRSDAEDFISKRLAPAQIPNDGRQTPMKGHPVFIAQHATAEAVLTNGIMCLKILSFRQLGRKK